MNAHCDIRDLGHALVVENRNAARRNALTPEYYQGLTAALRLAAETPRLGAVILTGEGGFFCAGGDLDALAGAAHLAEAGRRARIGRLQDLIRAVVACPRPVIAAIEGGAAGAGVSLAFACDLIVAARTARFTVAYVKAGLVPDGGLTATLPACLPSQIVAEMCLTGQPVGAGRLKALGAINALTEPGAAFAGALDMAARLANGPAEAQATIKRLLTGDRAARFEAQLAAETEAMTHAIAAAEAAEGIAAFLGKRPADFAALRREGPPS